MGFIYDDHGNICIEGRRASFIIHSDAEGPHPEFYIRDLDDLIAALVEYQTKVPHAD